MFAIAHMDFTLILWPYYVAVAAIYGGVTFLTDSIWPAIVLHMLGNLYSNTDLLLHGKAEWQAPAARSALSGSRVPDAAFIFELLGFVLIVVCSAWAYRHLAVSARALDPERSA